jgi:glycosidase
MSRRLPCLFAIVLPLACGSAELKKRDYGEPPDASLFNPGLGGTDGYGSGNNGGFVCPDELKRCAADFTYPAGTESSVELRGDYRSDAWMVGDKMQKQGNQWKVTVNVPYDKPVQYKFLVDGMKWVTDPNNPMSVSDGFGGMNSVRAPITCNPAICDVPPPPPAGVYDWRDAVIYFVFVDRFLDGDPSNNPAAPNGVLPPARYQGGDWKGVTQKINAGYFDDLGVNTLWLTVPVQNADTFAGQGVGGDSHLYSSYHGYWPLDPAQPEKAFGTLQDLKDLVSAAHAHKLKVIFDYAMVHVHISSPIYQQNPGWFWPNSYNNGDCICGQNCSWDAQGDRCWFTSYLPHWNYTVAAARDESVASAVKWITDTGADGFRLDAIKHVDISWLTQLRSKITSDVLAKQMPMQRFYMVGETYDFYNRDFIKGFVDPQTKLDGQFDFPLRRMVVESMLLKVQGMDALKQFMDTNDFYYGANAVMSTFVGNHDLPRIIHLAQEPPVWSNQADDGKNLAWNNQPQLPSQRKAFEKLANAFAVLFTNRGAPLVYYGDEWGMPGAGDPDNRRFMQWSGYSSDQQWLHDRIKTLLAIRAAHPALRRGLRTTASVTSDVWLFSMKALGDEVWVAINRSDSDQSVSGLPSQALSELVTGTMITGPNATIPARQTRIFSK